MASTLKNPKEGIMGVIPSPIFDIIEPAHSVFPILRVTLGLANCFLKDFLDFVDLNLEDAPVVVGPEEENRSS